MAEPWERAERRGAELLLDLGPVALRQGGPINPGIQTSVSAGGQVESLVCVHARTQAGSPGCWAPLLHSCCQAALAAGLTVRWMVCACFSALVICLRISSTRLSTGRVASIHGLAKGTSAALAAVIRSSGSISEQHTFCRPSPVFARFLPGCWAAVNWQFGNSVATADQNTRGFIIVDESCVLAIIFID